MPPAAGGDGKGPLWNPQKESGPQKELGHLVSQVNGGQGTVISSYTVCGNFLGLFQAEAPTSPRESPARE